MNERRLIEQELGRTFDLDARYRLVSALRAGRGTPEWSGALSLIGIRELGRDLDPPPGWEDRAAARFGDDQEPIAAARGRVVSAFAWLAAIALAGGCGLLLGWYCVQLIVRSL